MHPLPNASVVRTFVLGGSACPGLGLASSFQMVVLVGAPVNSSVRFLNSRQFSNFIKSLWRRSSTLFLGCSMMATQRFCKTHQSWACKIGKLDYLWKCWDVPGCVHLENIISSCDCARVLFPFAKVKNKAVFLTKKEIQWGKQAHQRIFTVPNWKRNVN